MEQKTISTEQNKNMIQANLTSVNTPAQTEIDLVELFFVLLSHWKSLLLCSLIGAVLFGAFHIKMVKSVYTATTELYITSTDSVISLSDLQLGSALTSDYQSIIVSRSVLNKVIEDLQLDTDYNKLRKLITVSNPTGTHIIRTSVSTNDLTLSRDIANDLLVVSIERIYQIVGTNEPTVIDYSEAEAVEDSTPGIIRNLVIGALVGFIAVAAVLTVGMVMNSSLKTEDDVEKYLQLPVLSAVPYYKE